MNSDLVFIGDIHGSIDLLDRIVERLTSKSFGTAVFLGDYVNKGPDSYGVIERLSTLPFLDRCVFLRGNHEVQMLDALLHGKLGPFLKAGGARTVRSYLQAPIGPRALDEFRAAVPKHHLEFLKSTDLLFETNEVIAQHQLPPSRGNKFRIGGHIPVGQFPRITNSYALIDTASGLPHGRLTALFWPSLEYIQAG